MYERASVSLMILPPVPAPVPVHEGLAVVLVAAGFAYFGGKISDHSAWYRQQADGQLSARAQ